VVCGATTAPHTTASCKSGVCTAVCVPGYIDCDGNKANGCEATFSSLATCGESCIDAVACDALSAATCVNGGCSDLWAGWPMPNSPADWSSGAPNLASYTDNGNGTVTDRVTGLIWQQAEVPNSFFLSDGVTYCSTLSLAGHSDWRLPSRIELLSIVDYTLQEPAIDSTAFPNTSATTFWSSTPAGSGYAWAVSFDIGGSGAYNVGTVSFKIRCVR